MRPAGCVHGGGRRAMEQGAGGSGPGSARRRSHSGVVRHGANVAVGRAARPVPDSYLLLVTVDFCLSHGVISS